MTLLNTGDKLPLNLQLPDGNVSGYVRAFLYDQNFSSVSGSPVNLSHLVRGLYFNNSFTIVSGIERLFTQYVVYSDPSYLTEDTNYSIVSEAWDIKSIKDIQEGVWNIDIGNHQSSGSTGEALYNSQFVSGSSPVAVANQVWNSLLINFGVSGSFGEAINTLLQNVSSPSDIQKIIDLCRAILSIQAPNMEASVDNPGELEANVDVDETESEF